MGRLAAPDGQAITLDFEGEAVPAFEGEPIASALIASGETVFARSIKYHRARGPFCLEGACSHCLMRVDGVPNVFTCRTPARPGMRLERQNAYPSVKIDVFESIDWLFPRGLDHHEMFAGVPVAEQVMAKVARHLAGLGLLPDAEAPPRMACQTIQTKVVIAGGGAAGSAAARVLSERGVPFVLCERERALGGRLRLDDSASAVANAPKGSLRMATPVIGFYDDAAGRFLAAIAYDAEGPRLLKLYAERFLLCVGGHAQLMPLENNDLPGVFFGRALALLLHRDRVAPGDEIALVGHGEELAAIAALVKQQHRDAVAILDLGNDLVTGATRARDVKIHGRSKVSGISFARENGRRSKIACDAIGLCIPPAPSFELARQAGARVQFDVAAGVFVVEADASGQTHAKDTFVAGDALRPMSAAASADSGKAAANAIAEALRG